jgi:hypothetical protein
MAMTAPGTDSAEPDFRRNKMDRMDETATFPFFIVGCPRSGTTLLQTLLDAHPHIAIPPESYLFERFGYCFEAYGDLRDPERLRQLVQDLLRDERIRVWKLEVSVEDFCEALCERTVRGVLSMLFSLYTRKNGKIRWGEKTPGHVFHLDQIRSIFPEAKFIHLVRDGRDVAESLSRVYFGKKSIWANARRWRQAVLAWHAFQERVPRASTFEVFYERLVEQPREEVAKILTFLQADAGAAPQELESTGLKETYTTAYSFHQSLMNPISRAKVGVFNKVFSEREIALFESVAGETLELYGYARATRGAAWPRMAERMRFFWQDYYSRFVRKLLNPAIHHEVKRELREAFQLRIRKLKRRLGRHATKA